MSKETIPPKGHTYGDWTVEREATLQDEGLRKHICTVCGFEEAEVIPMLVPETTAPADSDPDAADGSSDGKTMNTVLVGIMCFLIVAIAADIVAIVMVKKRRAGVKIGGAKRTDENEEDGGQPGDGYDETVKDMTTSRKTPMNPIMNRKTAISQEIIQMDILMSIPTAIPARMDTNRMNPAHRSKIMIIPKIITAMTRIFMRMNI